MVFPGKINITNNAGRKERQHEQREEGARKRKKRRKIPLALCERY
jgi:hypothetical protein